MNENERIEQIEEVEQIEQTERNEVVDPAVREEAAVPESPSSAPAEDAYATAFAEGRAVAEETLRAEIETLRASLQAAEMAAGRRETEIRCGRLLRERGISEELTAVLLAPGETEVAEETLQLRVAALSGAVEAAAVRVLRQRTDSVRPGAGDAAPITGKMLRETPVAKLMQIMT